jgi:hypothetical protein
MGLNLRHSLAAVTGLVVIAALLGASPATRPTAPDQAPALAAHIKVHMDLAVMSPLGIVASDVASALGAFFQTHETFDLEELQALEVTGEQGAKAPLAKIAKVEVRFERSSTTRPAVEK